MKLKFETDLGAHPKLRLMHNRTTLAYPPLNDTLTHHRGAQAVDHPERTTHNGREEAAPTVCRGAVNHHSTRCTRGGGEMRISCSQSRVETRVCTRMMGVIVMQSSLTPSVSHLLAGEPT